jgi:ATP-dependent RNA helicase DDX49/DBP8
MSASKRRTPTTDDLLRAQEEPQKRHKDSFVVQRDESGCSGTDDEEDFGWVSEAGDDNEWESGTEDSEGPDSEVSKESSPLVEPACPGLSNESPNLFGSRVTTKPRLVRQLPLSSGAGSSKSATFSSLDISPPLLSALSRMAIHVPTEIQRACIPPLLAGPLPLDAQLLHLSLTLTI